MRATGSVLSTGPAGGVRRGRAGLPGGCTLPPHQVPTAEQSTYLGHLALAVSRQEGHVVDLILDHEVLLLTLKVLGVEKGRHCVGGGVDQGGRRRCW